MYEETLEMFYILQNLNFKKWLKDISLNLLFGVLNNHDPSFEDKNIKGITDILKHDLILLNTISIYLIISFVLLIKL